MKTFAAVLPCLWLMVASAWGQTATPPAAPPKSFADPNQVPTLSNTDLGYIATLLDEWAKKSPEVANLVQIGATNPVLFQSLLQTLTLIQLADLARWQKLGALSTYAKVAPDSPILDAIARCYAEKMKDLGAFQTCVATLNDTTNGRTRGTFVQEQLGFSSKSVLETVLDNAADLALVRKYIYDYSLNANGRLTISNSPTDYGLYLRVLTEKNTFSGKLGSAPGKCDKNPIPAIPNLEDEDYVEAVMDTTLCSELAMALAIETVRSEAQSVLEKLTGARAKVSSLHAAEAKAFDYEYSMFRHLVEMWQAADVTKQGTYVAFKGRVRQKMEDRKERLREAYCPGGGC